MPNEHAVLEEANDNLRCNNGVSGQVMASSLMPSPKDNKFIYTVTNTYAHKGFSGGSLHITVSISK